MSIKSRIVNWFYPEIKKKDEAQEAATAWHPVPSCRFCGRPLFVECQFCLHCGKDLSERHTTAQTEVIWPKTDECAGVIVESSPTITELISTTWDPKKERLLSAYNQKIKPRKYGEKSHE